MHFNVKHLVLHHYQVHFLKNVLKCLKKSKKKKVIQVLNDMRVNNTVGNILFGKIEHKQTILCLKYNRTLTSYLLNFCLK